MRALYLAETQVVMRIIVPGPSSLVSCYGLLSTGLAPISRARTLTAVRSLLRFSHRAGALMEDLSTSVPLPRYVNTLARRIIAEDQVRKMIDLETGDRNQAIVPVRGEATAPPHTCISWVGLGLPHIVHLSKKLCFCSEDLS